MPTHHREIKASDLTKRLDDEAMKESQEDLDMMMKDLEMMKETEDEGFVIGPHGEKRPADPIASIAWAVQIGTGQRKEEYVDGKKPPPKKKVRII